MKYSLCTISFRHQLISFADIVRYAIHHRFDGIELWGIHAHNLFQTDRTAFFEGLTQIRDHGMCISMLSDYLDVSSEAVFAQTMEQCARLIEIAQSLGVQRLRTFAGRQSSRSMLPGEREKCTERLRRLGDVCKANDMYLLLETHPDTLTDCVDSAIRLMKELEHDHVRINLDFLHIWESGTDPVAGFRQLRPWVDYFHLKNVTSARDLDVFHPNNIYSASGNRCGIVPLRAGVLDYRAIIKEIEHTELFASLEWFGGKPLSILQDELEWLRCIHREGA
jgi:3-dehydroshikimate dehydratase